MKSKLEARRQELVQELNRVNRQIRDVRKEMQEIGRRIGSRQSKAKAA